MPANTSPIYSIKGSVTEDSVTTLSQPLTTAANDYTGASANNKLIFTAGTNGSFVSRLRFKALSTNVVTVARIYLNNGSANTTAANNSLYGELSLPATTASATAATVDIDYPMNFALPAGFRIFVGLGTTVANGWNVTPIAGDY